MPFRASVRSLRSFAYAALAVGGLVLLPVLGSFPGAVVGLWSVMAAWMILGGLVSLAGQLSRRWTGEFVGLPLLFSALFGFGVLQGNITDWPLAVVPSVAILWAFSLSLAARWLDVSALYRASIRGPS